MFDCGVVQTLLTNAYHGLWVGDLMCMRVLYGTYRSNPYYKCIGECFVQPREDVSCVYFLKIGG